MAGAEVTKTIRKRAKRIRTAYTTDQLRVLERTFYRIKYIDAEKRRQLAESLNISEKSIKVWFQNRRMKEKRESESSSDSSTEVTTTETSPSLSSPRPLPSVSPADAKPFLKFESNQFNNSQITPVDVKVYPKVESNQFHNSQISADPSHYQLPNFHFCNHLEYNASAVTATEPFTSDRSTYPTYYYPTLDNYYYGESYRNDYANVGSYETQWSANNFDLNYFQ